MMRSLFAVLTLAILPTAFACGSDDPVDGANTGTAAGGTVGSGGDGSGAAASGGNSAQGGKSAQGGAATHPDQPGVIGYPGIAAWDALAAGEKSVVTSNRSFFLHQSVGEDLEDGAQAGGFAFEYAISSDTNLKQGLNGGLFSSSNGDPAGKIAEFRSMALANSGSLRVAIMKFGYADIVADKVAGAQSAYQAAVSDVKGAGVRVLHVTPPLVYNVPAENAPKVATRAWMMKTFPNDVIFDLQDAESTDPSSGSRCERGGSWEICDSVRSTSGCPSKAQGVDSPSGQGHLCFDPHAQQIAKAFLYAIYQAAK